MSRAVVSLIIIGILIITSCKKQGQPAPKKCFTAQIPDLFYDNVFYIDTPNYVDASYFFQSCADSVGNTSYLWKFGDGNISTEKNPEHKYASRGKFQASLQITNGEGRVDSSSQQLTVILGQRLVTNGEGIDLYVVGLEQLSSGDYIMLSRTNGFSGYRLTRLDSMFHKKSVKTFPLTYRLNSLKATSDGSFIFTGSISESTKQNEIIKMTADGDLIWNRVMVADEILTYATEAPDGGIVASGSRQFNYSNGRTVFHTLVYKLDKNGQLEWKNSLDKVGLAKSKGFLLEPDGIVLAGGKPETVKYCSDCDSVIIVKLGNNGNLLWSGAVFGGSYTSQFGLASVLKRPDGKYLVACEGGTGLYYFSPGGLLTDRRVTIYNISSVLNSTDGRLIVLEQDYNNGSTLRVMKYDAFGIQVWSTAPEGRQKLNNSILCCSSTSPIAMSRLKNGNVLVIGTRALRNSTGYNNTANGMMFEIDDDGKMK